MSREKIRITLKRAPNPTSFLTTSEQIQNKKTRIDSGKAADKNPFEELQKTYGERNKSHSDRSGKSSPLTSTIQPKSRPSSSSSNSSPSVADDENPLPAAFRIVNESESSDESGAERSEHEEEVVRRSKQIRNRERWELLKYKMLTSSCCTPSINPSKDGNGPPAMDEGGGEDEQWDEEREREFVFSLL